MTSENSAPCPITALCIWEDLLRRIAENSDSDVGLFSYKGRYGAAEMRQKAIDLADYVDTAYKLIDEGTRDTFAFDWEIVPLLLDLLTWTTYGYDHPTPAIAAGIVSIQLSHKEHFEEFSWIQVSGCMTDPSCPESECRSIIQCSDLTAEFYTIYGRGDGPVTRALIDCKTRTEAETIAAKLADIYQLRLSSAPTKTKFRRTRVEVRYVTTVEEVEADAENAEQLFHNELGVVVSIKIGSRLMHSELSDTIEPC